MDALSMKEPTEKQRKDAIDDFEYMRNMAEARAYASLSQKRPLTKEEFERYKHVCEKVGIKPSVPRK